MPTIAALFPRLSALIPEPTGWPAELDFSWKETDRVQELLAVLVSAQNACGVDISALEKVSLAALDDLFDQRSEMLEGGVERIRNEFVQFWVSCGPLNTAAGQRRFGIARDWALRALMDTYDPDVIEPIDTLRLRSFTSSAMGGLRVWGAPTVLEWACPVFYVSWATGDLLDLARAVEPMVAVIALGRLSAPDLSQTDQHLAVKTLAEVVQWQFVYAPDRAGIPARILGSIEDDERNPSELRRPIAILLSGPVGALTDLAPAERAQRTLARYGVGLEGQEFIGVLSNALADDVQALVDHVPDFLAAIEQHREALSAATPVDRLYDRGRLFRNSLAPTVVNLAKSGQAAAALQLLASWQGVEEVRDDAVLLIQGTAEGTYWIVPGQSGAKGSGTQILGELTAAANRALGLAVTYIDGHEAGQPEPVARPGVPNYQEASAYEDAAVRHLNLDGLTLCAASESLAAVIPIPALPVPIVALAHRHTATVLPIAASLQSPLPDRRPERVLIWHTNVLGTAEEVEAVTAFFEVSGVTVEVVDSELTVEHFAACYARRELDVLWVTCHGEYAAYTPEESHLALGEEQLSLEQLLTLEAPASCERRLLVLNACDSGTVATLGGLTEFGLGSLLAGPTQAVIGHQWPSDWSSSAGFAAVLGFALASGQGFRAAFGQALVALRGGPVAMLNALPDAPPELGIRKHLSAAAALGTDHGLLHWGSPVFLE